jgi:NADP-dependent 3-hydroxy acid dehydrogenase YdfG
VKSCLDLTDRVAVVFGGTSGLGKEIAIGLAEHGAHVVPAGRREELLQQACEEISKQGRRTFHQPVDVKDRAAIDKFRDSILNELGQVDILVNAAGTTFRKPTISVSAAEWSALFDTNLTGILQACQALY